MSRKRSSRHARDVGLDDLLGFTPRLTSPTPRRRPLRGIFNLVASSVGFGLVISTMVMPGVLVAGGATQKALTAWEDMDAELGNVVAAQRTVLVDTDGKQWGQLFSENRVNVTLADINPVVVDALIATEDSRFYEHGGLDIKGLARAVVNNAIGSGSTQGASTLSQQLVENLRVVSATTDEQRTAARAQSLPEKLGELRYAAELERRHSKDEILEMYLNTAYFGNGAYGIATAAQRYFSVTAADLSVDQAATLIAMLKSPSAYDPIANPEASLARRNTVMGRMVAVGALDESTAAALSEIPTALKPSKPKAGCGASDYPYYCQLVIEYILSHREFGAEKADRERFLSTGGLTITASLDRAAMAATEKAVGRALTKSNRIAAGVATIEPGTGRLLSIGQNRDWGASKEGKFNKTEIVYANAPAFQSGSTFKPVTLAAALEEGIGVRQTYSAPSGYKPKGLDAPKGGFRNSGGGSYASMDAYAATRASVNTWFVKLIADVGVKDTAAMANRLGMTSVPTNLSGKEASLTLGAYETSPIQLASAYATFAARGVSCEPVLIDKIVQTDTGDEIAVPDGNCHQAIMPVVADTVADTLLEPFKAGGTASGLALSGGRKAGGKTGTTNSNAATWFAGFTPQAATAVWVGDPRGGTRYPVTGIRAYGRSYGTVFGSTVAGPIWKDLMDEVHKGKKKSWLPSPKGAAASLTGRLVPSVAGMDLDAAATLLLEQGFKVNVSPDRPKVPAIDTPGYVATQSPAPGSKTGWGSTITLTPTAGTPRGITIEENR